MRCVFAEAEIAGLRLVKGKKIVKNTLCSMALVRVRAKKREKTTFLAKLWLE